MKIARIWALVVVLSLLMAASAALAEDTGMREGYILVSGNETSIQVQANVEPNEGTVFADDTLGGDRLRGVAGADGTLVVDCTTAYPNPTMLMLPLMMIAETKGSDTNTQIQAWTEMGHSATMFDNAYMKTIFGTAITEYLKELASTKLRAITGEVAKIWDTTQQENGSWLNTHAAGVQASPIALTISLVPLDVSASWTPKTVENKPVIGGVDVSIGVGGNPLNTSNKTGVRTRFALPAGGIPAGVRVLHEDAKGRISPVDASVSGSDVYFETAKQGMFYVVYDELAAQSAHVDLPDTGDTSRFALWLAMLCGCAGLAWGMKRRKKMQNT